jgi:sugar/nucleoside kinase (ribokinase family)
MPSKIVVVGVASVYMSVGVEELPVRYAAKARPRWMRHGVTGVGDHVAQILHTLGNDVRLCTIAGRDEAGLAIRAHLSDCGLLGEGVIDGASSLGVVLVAPDGSRMGYPYLAAVNAIEYPADVFCRQADGADLAVLTNARFVRPLVEPAARLGVPIAVDVHVIADLDDEYNRPWLEVADIVFCSHERLGCAPEDWVRAVFRRYPGCAVVGVGSGPRGCLLGLRDGRLIEVAAVAVRGVVSTSGAGDALFASFLHGWLATGNPVEAIEAAVLHAGWKIGDSFPSASSLTEADLARLRASHPVRALVRRWDAGPVLTPGRGHRAGPARPGSAPRAARRAG